MPRLGALAPFRIRSYRFQWPADLLTSWAFEMETMVLGWYVLVETNSVVMLTVFGALLYGGTLIAPIVGVWSDRHRPPHHAVGDAGDLCPGRRVRDGARLHRHAAARDRAGAGRLTGLVRPSDMGLRGALIADTMPSATLTPAMGIAAHHVRHRPHLRRADRRRHVRGHRHRADLCGDHGVLSARRDPDLERHGGDLGARRSAGCGDGAAAVVRGTNCGKASCWSGTRRGCWRSCGTRCCSISRCFR